MTPSDDFTAGPPAGAKTAADCPPNTGLWNFQPRVRGCLTSISAETKAAHKAMWQSGRCESTYGK